MGSGIAYCCDTAGANQPDCFQPKMLTGAAAPDEDGHQDIGY
jgi:hypothetical protein